ncbi:hypothetical protein K1719_022924 [Acacia pycnantha]|nr:hypothetical protein K1719_022924 [Acacia pycnantha]
MDNHRASQSQRKGKNHSFFKALIEDFSTRLKIPSDFNKVLGKEVPKKAILETYYGKSEEVEVEKHENRFCFCKGWSNSKQPSSEEKENEEPKSLHSDNQIEFKSERPSFRVILKSSSISSYMNIPLSFARKYIKESQSQEIKVETPNKKVWELGRLFVLWGAVDEKKEMAGARLTQRWRNLVSEYHLQMGDICLFELIQPTHVLVFHLHVFRQDAQNKFIRIL